MRHLRHQLAEAFRFSLPLVAALREPADVSRQKCICSPRFVLRCAQLLYFDEQQLHFPPHYYQRIGRVRRLGRLVSIDIIWEIVPATVRSHLLPLNAPPERCRLPIGGRTTRRSTRRVGEPDAKYLHECLQRPNFAASEHQFL
jgi:hypothetical protein